MLPAKRAGLGVAEPRAAMAADVVKRARAALAVADDEDAGAGDVAADESAARCDLIDAARGDPHAGEDPLHLRREPRRIGVDAGRQGRSCRDA